MNELASCFLAGICLALLPSTATAEPGLQPFTPDQVVYQPKARWYGLPILVADASVVVLGTLVPLGFEPNTSGLAVFPWVSLGSLATGPIVHLAHHDVGLCFASLGVRTVSFVTGFFAGLTAASRVGPDPRAFGEAYHGVASLFIAGASALDATVFAWQRTKRAAPSASLPMPWVIPARDGVVLGLGGAL